MSQWQLERAEPMFKCIAVCGFLPFAGAVSAHWEALYDFRVSLRLSVDDARLWGPCHGSDGCTSGLGALWRFGWSHSDERIRNYDKRWSTYFDVDGDPIGLAAERAALALFRRGDLKPLEQAAVIQFSRKYLSSDAAYASNNGRCGDAIWHRRIGIAVGEPPLGVQVIAADGRPLKQETEQVSRWACQNSSVSVDVKRGAFTVDSPLTQGAFLRSGDVSLSGLSFGVKGCFATVWMTSLDSRPLNDSKHILVSHLTESLNSGATFADETRTVMTALGHVPHLMRRGSADCRLTVAAGDYRLYALASNGSRLSELPCRLKDGKLCFTLDVCAVPGTATCCYEIVRVEDS